MRVSQKFAGFSMAEADNLRKACGKKIPEKMEEARGSFVTQDVQALDMEWSLARNSLTPS